MMILLRYFHAIAIQWWWYYCWQLYFNIWMWKFLHLLKRNFSEFEVNSNIFINLFLFSEKFKHCKNLDMKLKMISTSMNFKSHSLNKIFLLLFYKMPEFTSNYIILSTPIYPLEEGYDNTCEVTTSVKVD